MVCLERCAATGYGLDGVSKENEKGRKVPGCLCYPVDESGMNERSVSRREGTEKGDGKGSTRVCTVWSVFSKESAKNEK